MEEFVFPQWLDDYRLDDAFRANAFETADIKHKGRIKTAIALHFAKEEEGKISYSKIKKNAFSLEETIKACEVTLFFVDKNFTSPALFISAIMPALFAKSPVGIVFRQMPSENIVLAAELLGLEHLFLFSKEEEGEYSVERLILQLSKLYKSFTFIVLGENNEYDSMLAHEMINYNKFSRNLSLLISKNDEEIQAYKAGYPQSNLYCSYLDLPVNAKIDIFSSKCEDIDKFQSSSVILEKDCEWYYPFLFPLAQFQVVREYISYCNEEIFGG